MKLAFRPLAKIKHLGQAKFFIRESALVDDKPQIGLACPQAPATEPSSFCKPCMSKEGAALGEEGQRRIVGSTCGAGTYTATRTGAADARGLRSRARQ